jgi:hypothetical protein
MTGPAYAYAIPQLHTTACVLRYIKGALVAAGLPATDLDVLAALGKPWSIAQHRRYTKGLGSPPVAALATALATYRFGYCSRFPGHPLDVLLVL